MLNASDLCFHSFNVCKQVSIIPVNLLFEHLMHIRVLVHKLSQLPFTVFFQGMRALIMCVLSLPVDVGVVFLRMHRIGQNMVSDHLCLHRFNLY